MELYHLRKCSLVLYEQRGLPLAAKDVLAQWYALAKECDAYEDQIQALLVSGLNWLQMRQPNQAVLLFEKALELIDRHGTSDNDRGVTRAHALFDLALAHEQTGDIDRALEYALQAWQGTERRANLHADAQMALQLGKIYIARECWSEAYSYNKEALLCFEELGDASGRSRALNNLGLICVETGDYDQAQELLEEALVQKKQSNEPNRSVYTLTELGRLHYKKGDLATAMHFSRMALETLWESVAFMDKAEVARLFRLFGSIAAQTGDRRGAIGYLQRAITYYGQLNQWREWSAVTRELDALIRQRHETTSERVYIEWQDKESLRTLTTLLGLMDTLEGLYPELSGRSELVTKYALLLGDACGLTGQTRVNLSHAARLAHIGLTFPDVDPEARTTLLSTEYRELPLLGERVLSMAPVTEDCRVAVRHQYERYDGSGYPDGLKGKDIPIIARILAIVDAYVSRASSGGPDEYLHEQAMRYVQDHSGTRFDPDLVNIFTQMHEICSEVVV